MFVYVLFASFMHEIMPKRSKKMTKMQKFMQNDKTPLVIIPSSFIGVSFIAFHKKVVILNFRKQTGTILSTVNRVRNVLALFRDIFQRLKIYPTCYVSTSRPLNNL